VVAERGLGDRDVDVVYGGEGSVGKGYPCDIDPAVLGFPETFRRFPLAAPGWFHTESDNGPGPATDPGRSLRWAKVSARYMLSLSNGRGRRDAARTGSRR
jgi:hypothetical protein